MDAKLNHVKHLFYPVFKVPSIEVSPGYEFTAAQEYAIVVNKDGVQKVVNHCSDVYEVVPNLRVVTDLLKAFEGTDIKVTGWAKHDSRFAIDMVFMDKSLSMGKGDDIAPKLRINNSYDGRVKYAFNLGFYRLICSNGMVIPLEGFEDKNIDIKMRHTPAITDYTDTEEIMDMVNGFKANMKDFATPYRELQKKKVISIEERVAEVIENTKFPTRRAEDVVDRITEEMGLLHLNAAGITDWLVYNGLNYQLNHSTDIQMDSHKKEALDQQVLTYLLEN